MSLRSGPKKWKENIPTGGARHGQRRGKWIKVMKLPLYSLWEQVEGRTTAWRGIERKGCYEAGAGSKQIQGQFLNITFDVCLRSSAGRVALCRWLCRQSIYWQKWLLCLPPNVRRSHGEIGSRWCNSEGSPPATDAWNVAWKAAPFRLAPKLNREWITNFIAFSGLILTFNLPSLTERYYRLTFQSGTFDARVLACVKSPVTGSFLLTGQLCAWITRS